jgi:hypothetical protein
MQIGDEVKVGNRTVIVEDVTEWGTDTYVLFKYDAWPIVVTRQEVEKSGTSLPDYLANEVNKIDRLVAGGYLKPLLETKAVQVDAGTVGVDSGKLLIIDPCYLQPGTKKHPHGRKFNKHYEECNEATHGGAGQLESLFAVAASTNGDGNFGVMVTKKHGKVLKLEIEIMTEADADQSAALENVGRASIAAEAAVAA